MRCKSVDSGVVRAPVSVPITDVDQPCCRRIDANMCAVVVLPFVPVMPITFNFSLGRLNNSAARYPIVERTSLTTICVTSTSTRRSTRTATAPFATATFAKLWPSTFSPTMQQNMTPFEAFEESCVISETFTFALPII